MSFLGSLVDAGISAEINKQNLAFQQSAIDQNMALTRESWARDDNAIQRRVADLKAAGLNPILAAGSAAGNSNPIRVEPKKSDFKTDFGSSSLAEDVSKVQAIKANSLENKMRALQNSILQEQEEGYRLDNERKRLDIKHYGETPTVKFWSTFLENVTGMSFEDAAKKLGIWLGFRSDDSGGYGKPSAPLPPMSTEPAPIPRQTVPEAEVTPSPSESEQSDFFDKFSVLVKGGSTYYHVDWKTGEFTLSTKGQVLVRSMANDLHVPYFQIYNQLKAYIQNYTFYGEE